MNRQPRDTPASDGPPQRWFGRRGWPAAQELPSAAPLASYTPRTERGPIAPQDGDPSSQRRADVSPADVAEQSLDYRPLLAKGSPAVSASTEGVTPSTGEAGDDIDAQAELERANSELARLRAQLARVTSELASRNAELAHASAELGTANAQLERSRQHAVPISRAQVARAEELLTEVNATIDRLTVRVAVSAAGA